MTLISLNLPVTPLDYRDFTHEKPRTPTPPPPVKEPTPIPSSSSSKGNQFSEVDIIENAVSYIQKLKSQLSNEDIMMLDQMFSLSTTSSRK